MIKRKVKFYGPIDDAYGPGIKNKYTINFLEKKFDTIKFNTFRMSFFKKVKLFFSLLFDFDNCVIAVSSGGRKKMLPILHLKKCLFPKFKYSVIIINGYIINEIEQNAKVVKYLKKADRIFVEIDQLKNDLMEKYGFNNVSYFPNFKDINQYLERSNIQNNDMNQEIKCVFLSRVSKDKGVDTLIKAFEITTNRKITLDIFGPISDDAVDIINRELPKNVKYCGVVENSNVTTTLSNYNVFIFPSKYKFEGFPAAIVDAYSAGLFVISTPIAYLPYIVSNEENGIVLKDFELISLVNTLNSLTDIQKIKDIGLNNFNCSMFFSTSIVFEKFLKEFDDIGW